MTKKGPELSQANSKGENVGVGWERQQPRRDPDPAPSLHRPSQAQPGKYHSHFQNWKVKHKNLGKKDAFPRAVKIVFLDSALNIRICKICELENWAERGPALGTCRLLRAGLPQSPSVFFPKVQPVVQEALIATEFLPNISLSSYTKHCMTIL